MSIAEPPRMTANELLTRAGDEPYEVVRGQLVERLVSHHAVWIATRLVVLLSEYLKAKPIGDVYGEGASYQCFPHDPEMVRRPDVSVILQGRLPYGQFLRGHVRIVPDLAVEVVSPRDLAYDVVEKLEDYLRAGVAEVWQVNPTTRTVTVYAEGGRRVAHLHEDDELTGGTVLPGFACRVGELFPPRDPARAPAIGESGHG
jgi:Uma2 family endonuclease